jgi:Predicted acetyltransferase involved in intracellular survival and related acetyltransferases
MDNLISQLKSLHKDVFKDGDFYADFFFEKRFSPEAFGYIPDESGKPVSALYARPFDFDILGKRITAPFLTGIATLPAYRGRHYASRLVREALEKFCKKEVPFCVLHPFHADFYRKLNFEAINFAEETTINYAPAPGISYRRLAEADLELTLALYERRAKKFPAYRVRSLEEQADVLSENFGGGGAGYLLFKDGEPCGYALADEKIIAEYTGDEPAFLSGIKELDGFKFKAIGEGEPYSMAAVCSPEALVSSVPIKDGAEGRFTFLMNGKNYFMNVGDGEAVLTPTINPPLFGLAERELVSAALGGGRRYVGDNVPREFTNVFPEYKIFVDEKY